MLRENCKKAQKRAKETEENRRKRKTMMLQLARGEEERKGVDFGGSELSK